MAACGGSSKNKEQSAGTENAKATAYICPMDCEKGKTYSEVGKCPVCGMDLEIKK